MSLAAGSLLVACAVAKTRTGAAPVTAFGDQVAPAFPATLATAAAPSTRPAHSRRGRARTSTVVARAGAPRPWAAKTGRLVLATGQELKGVHFGASGCAVGEVVFNTSLTGYQEIMTDPSYAGQFVTFTHPHIGNTGVNEEDAESSKCHLGAIIVRDRPALSSNYREEEGLDAYCARQGVVGISDVDTRALTIAVRDSGCLNAVVTDDLTTPTADLAARAAAFDIGATDYIAQVTTKEPYEWNRASLPEWEVNESCVKVGVSPYLADIAAARGEGNGPRIVAYDFGIKRNILKRLASYGCRITVVPASTTAAEVMAMNPDGVFFSNGPGDPSVVPYAVAACKDLLGKVPCFGICMGHQVMGQALGAATFKLPFGHHGGNHPIRFSPGGRVQVSAQNHNYAVDPAGLPADVAVTHVNLNDGTCAGFASPARRFLAIQYHPEAGPGPRDADVCFAMFMDLLSKEGVDSASWKKVSAMMSAAA